MQDRTLKLIVIIALVFSIISISACIFMYQKTGGNQVVQKAGTSAGVIAGNSQSQSLSSQGPAIGFDVKIPEKAKGFLGLPESKITKINENEANITLRGHWTIDEKPTFDFIGDPDYKEASASLPVRIMRITKNTSFQKMKITGMSGNKINSEPITPITAATMDDLKNLSLEDPVFVILSKETNPKEETELAAKSVLIFSGYSQFVK